MKDHLLPSEGATAAKCTRARERDFDHSVCLAVASLHGSGLSLSYLIQQGHSPGIALGTVHSRLFSPRYMELPCLSSPLQSFHNMSASFALHSLLQRIPGHAIHTLHPSLSEHPDGTAKRPLPYSEHFQLKAADHVVAASQSHQGMTGTRISALKGANLYWCGHEPVYTYLETFTQQQ